MTSPDRRADAESRLRRAFDSLRAARVLLSQDLPLRDDAVNRASVAALNAARALVGAQWAKISSSGWDPSWRPGMSRPPDASGIDRHSRQAYDKLLDRFQELTSGAGLPADFTLYLRALVDDGFEADSGETPEYDTEESEHAVTTAWRLVAAVADQLSLGDEFRARSAGWPGAAQDPSAEPLHAAVRDS
jgi:hypothetical protein